MAKLKEGDKAPAFSVPASNGKEVALKDYKGKKRVVLYFYPKDSTPGCTIEACGFRDANRKFASRSTVVLGVSPDGIASHEKFITKYDLPFLLLSDEDKKLCRSYGVWAKKKLYGKEFMGVLRTTFVIAKTGKIEKIYNKVKPQEHSEEILDFLSGD